MNPFLAKLNRGDALSATDQDEILKGFSKPRRVAARQILVKPGERPKNVMVVLEGVACRAKCLLDERRQVLALLLPGDCTDLHFSSSGVIDHCVITLAPCLVADAPGAAVDRLALSSDAIQRAFWRHARVDEAISREWLVNLGVRSAEERVAHFFCEVRERLDQVGLVRSNGFSLRMTQRDLADTIGFSNVHLNRILKRMCREKLVCWSDFEVQLPDYKRLTELCSFSPDYLRTSPGLE